MSVKIPLENSALCFSPGDRVRHSRLGSGRVLGRKNDGKLIILFDGNPKADVLFPFQLEHFDNADRFRRSTSPTLVESSNG